MTHENDINEDYVVEKLLAENPTLRDINFPKRMKRNRKAAIRQMNTVRRKAILGALKEAQALIEAHPLMSAYLIIEYLILRAKHKKRA